MPTNETGVVLTCTNDECGCRLRIEEPCPHGDTYTCACGHPLVEAVSPLATRPPDVRVVVVGATGNVGSALVAALSADPDVDEVVGVARRLPELELPGVTWVAADIVRDDLRVVRRADVVVHLAWRIQPQRHETAMYETNVTGTRRLLDAVARHGVPAFVYASSVGAYAPGPKDRAVDESWPATGIPSSTYSRHKAAVEAMLDEFGADHPALRIVRMRTSLVFQRAAGSEVLRLFVGPWAPRRLPGPLRVVPDAPGLVFQAAHASDVAEAYRLAVHAPVVGAFNIASEPVLTPAVMAAALGARPVAVPARLLRAAASASWHLRLQRSEPGWLDMATETPIMDVGRARRELGWSAQVPATEALAEVVAGIGLGAGASTVPLHPRGRGPVLAPGSRP